MKTKVLRVTEWFVLVFWLGAVYSVSLLVIPKVFAVLPHPFSGDFTGALFPTFFRLNLMGAAVAMFIHTSRRPWVSRAARAKTVLLALMGIAIALNLVWLVPKVSLLREQMAQFPDDFKLWHGFSMGANLLVLLAGIPLIILTALERD